MEDSYIITQALDILNRLHEFDEVPVIKMFTAFKHLTSLGRLNVQASLGSLVPNPPTQDLPPGNAFGLFVLGHLVAVQTDVTRDVIERVAHGKIEVVQDLVIYPGKYSDSYFPEKRDENELRVARCFAYMEAASQHRTLEGKTLHAQTRLETKSSSRL